MLASEVEYKYGGKLITASSKASSTDTGFSGFSAGDPYLTWNFPSFPI